MLILLPFRSILGESLFSFLIASINLLGASYPLIYFKFRFEYPQ